MTGIGKVKVHRSVTQRKYTTITNACPLLLNKNSIGHQFSSYNQSLFQFDILECSSNAKSIQGLENDISIAKDFSYVR